jgi:hypothetical protein
LEEISGNGGPMKIRMLFLVALFAVLFGACTIRHQARLYDLETGDVILVNARIRGNRAIDEAILPSGEHCKGESISGGGGAVSWGNIYSHYYGSASYSSATIPLSQRGVMTMVCEKGITFDCEYTVKSHAVEGHGICRDNRGKLYRLMF